jgi:archaellum biogenesis ATPase FlaH
MRLLKYEEDGSLTITSFDDDAIPPYAILSHTWGADTEEVTFAEVVNANGQHKIGYEKIRFCGEQARKDGLQYFWVDTCCIDKTDQAELSTAIRSMFRWYQNATKCYVYLPDVLANEQRSDEMFAQPWEPAFRSSRWFTRGWTLQELLAPSKVEFFTQEGEMLGDKTSLTPLISKITGIPPQVLRGTLAQFDIEERLRWRGNRKTKLEEDMAYSLSGICDVDIAPVYGEGEKEAFRRLHYEIRKLKDCIRDLRSSDPHDDKRRIEDTKGGLLADSYRWVLDNDTFQQWQQHPHTQDPHAQLLWVKGDPGKGKTMLLCGIINELQQSLMPQSTLLAYFFCQAADPRINSATAVLRGLLYMLITQQPSLMSRILKKYDTAGKDSFEDANAWVVLSEIFGETLHDPYLRPTYLIIDALDECVTDLPKLLEFIAKQSSTSSRVKWIVSSRNWPEIEEQLEQQGEHQATLSLELNADSVSAAVDVFIQRKVDQLAREKQYKAELRDAVVQHLRSNAGDTFLWVALVCQDLRKTPKWNVLKKLASVFPPTLDSLYGQMMDQISKSEFAEICQDVLASAAILYRPVTIAELFALVEQLEDVDDLESVRQIVGFCGSFLTLREDTIYFVHQSAKDFLFAKAFNSKVFKDSIENVHQTMFSRSLSILDKTLEKDMYNLEAPGYAIENVKIPEPDPLAESRYSCVYWIDHLYDSKPDFLQVADRVAEFLEEKYLYWLEGLSLCRGVGRGVVSMTKLSSLVQVGPLNRVST